MAKRRKKNSTPLPLLLTELTLASFETVAWRTALMAFGGCGPREYRRMVVEKAAAAREAAAALYAAAPHDAMEAALAPWHRRATANARRFKRR